MFFLLGPTAAGKSELAVEVALRCNAEIVGVDAFQVYRGLEILTAAPSRELRARVPHHLVSEISMAEKFDAARYRELALQRISEIEGRGKRVLIVGGTGLYVRALIAGLSEMPESEAGLRLELDAMDLVALQIRYAELDPEGIARIDTKNKRRLVRAIEVSILAGKPYSAMRADWRGGDPVPASANGVALERDRTELYARIEARVERMFDEGIVEEVRAATPGPTAEQAIGLAEIQQLLRGEISQVNCIAAIQQRTRRYAKRQLTWLRGGNKFPVLNLTQKTQSEAAGEIAEMLIKSAASRGEARS